MTPLPANELDRRIHALLDGAISGEEHRELESVLLSDESARRRYMGLAALHGLLEIEAEQRSNAIRQGPVPVDLVVFRQRRRVFRVAAISAAAVLLAGAFVLRLLFVPPPATATVAMSEGTVFTISHASMLAKPPPEGSLMPGSTLRITQGTVELTFGSGVKAIVQGPETLTVIDRRSIAMREGVAWFHVPAAATGFEVRTPELRVVDLGTEFGVIARPDAADEVHVFKGKVRAEALQGVCESGVLTVNQARATFVSGKLKETKPQPERFLTKLPPGLPYLHWGFEEPDPASFRASGTHPRSRGITATPRAVAHPSALRNVPGRIGRGFATDGTGAFLTTNWEGIGGNAPRGIAYWIRLKPGVSYLDPVLGWGERSGLRSFFAGVDHSAQNGRAVSLVSFENVWFEGTTHLDDGVWHHIAYAYTGGRLPDGGPEVLGFVDGKPDTLRLVISPEASPGEMHPVETDITSHDAFPLTLFCHLYGAPDGIRNPVEIDELFVFPGAITAEQVGNIFRFNRPEPPPFKRRPKNSDPDD